MVCVKSVENLIRPREKKGVRTSYYGISSLVESFSALFSWACTFHKHMPSLACWLPKVRALPHKILPRSRAFLQNLAEVGHEIWRFRPGHLEESWRRASSKSCEKFPGLLPSLVVGHEEKPRIRRQTLAHEQIPRLKQIQTWTSKNPNSCGSFHFVTGSLHIPRLNWRDDMLDVRWC